MNFEDEKDYIMRLIKEMVRVLFSLMLGKSYISVEEEKQNKALAAVEDDLPLFEVLKEKVEDTPKNPALEKLRALDVDSLSPREALDKLYELKADAAKGDTQGGF